VRYSGLIIGKRQEIFCCSDLFEWDRKATADSSTRYARSE
jgi:hypothetical protein